MTYYLITIIINEMNPQPHDILQVKYLDLIQYIIDIIVLTNQDIYIKKQKYNYIISKEYILFLLLFLDNYFM